MDFPVSELTFIVAGLLVLGYCSTRFVRVLSSLSYLFKLPTFFLSFIVLGLGTSLPDLFVGAFASASGNVPLVIGSIIGANITVLCFILGVITIIKGEFKVREKTVLENFGWIFFVLMIPAFMLFDGRLTVFEGLILIVVYLMYVYNVTEQEAFLKRGRGFQTELLMGDEPPKERYYKHVLFKEISKAIVFLGLVLISADFVVSHAVALSANFKIPQILVGMTVIALGVTLPELAVDLSALRAREEEIIWGDLIGSFITELTLVLGVVALFAAPTTEALDFSQALVGYVFMAIAFLLVFFFTYSKKCLTKAEGIALILLYVIFLSLQFDMFLFKAV